MHAERGVHAAAHFEHVPSMAAVHCLYVRSLWSYMQWSAGSHAAPKWKHAPAPPARHVKYVAVPAWYAHDVDRHPISGATAPTTGAAEPDPEPEPAFVWTFAPAAVPPFGFTSGALPPQATRASTMIQRTA